MNYIWLCKCHCGGNVISRFNGNGGFCEDCNRMYEKDHDDGIEY